MLEKPRPEALARTEVAGSEVLLVLDTNGHLKACDVGGTEVPDNSQVISADPVDADADEIAASLAALVSEFAPASPAKVPAAKAPAKKAQSEEKKPSEAPAPPRPRRRRKGGSRSGEAPSVEAKSDDAPAAPKPMKA